MIPACATAGLLLLAAPSSQSQVEGFRLDLAGAWHVRMDGIEGVHELHLPGTLDRQGLGHALGRPAMRYPVEVADSAWPALAPAPRADEAGHLVRERLFVGRARYERAVSIPEAWAGRELELLLERVLWSSRVEVDGRAVGGMEDSLVAPHRHLLGRLAPGRHLLSVDVDNGLVHPIGILGHAYGPETQGRWNGILGRIELRALPAPGLGRVRVFPGAERRSLRVRADLRGLAGGGAPTVLECTLLPEGGGPALARASTSLDRPVTGAEIEVELSLSTAAEPWNEFRPIRYRLEAVLRSGEEAATVQDRREVLFGFRSMVREGRRLLLDGRPLFLRGTLDCAAFPRTGHPPLGVEGWLERLGTMREYGFNHVRFHTWCPPEAAFEAADRLGILLQVETPFWVDDWSTTVGLRPRPLGEDPEVAAFVRRELERIQDEYGNHPSLALLCIGNEFGSRGTDWDLVEDLVAAAKDRDGRQLVLGCTARRAVAADDLRVTHQVEGVAARGIGPPRSDWDRGDAVQRAKRPVIAHETGQRPVFPDYPELLPAFDGPLRPWNLERFRLRLEDSGLGGRLQDFVQSSARFQRLLYKAEHEGLRRTPGWAGYQLLMLSDFPGQGEALVGVLDPFLRPKTAGAREDTRRWNAPVVVLARLPRYTWNGGEELAAEILLANDGSRSLDGVAAAWRILGAGGREVEGGLLPPVDVPAGARAVLGEIHAELPEDLEPMPMELQVEAAGAANSWSLFVAPPVVPQEPAPGGVRVVRTLDAATRSFLAGGGRVLLLAHGRGGWHAARTGFASVYWTAAWWGNRYSHLGFLADASHPALAGLVPPGGPDWTWYGLLEGATTFDLSWAPAGLRPLVQPVPDFHWCTRLGQLFECRAGRGRLLVCGYDLETQLDRRPLARSLRAALLRYLAGKELAPATEIPLGSLAGELGPSRLAEMGARVIAADAEAPGYEASHLADGDPQTLWHTPWTGARPPGFPHFVVLDLGRPMALTRLRFLQRQDPPAGGRLRNVEVRGYRSRADALAGKDGVLLLRAELASGPAPQEFRVPAGSSVRFLRLTALSSHEGGAWASLAEMDADGGFSGER